MNFTIPDVSNIDLNRISRSNENEPDFIPSASMGVVGDDISRRAVYGKVYRITYLILSVKI